jgi:hypothetical protein
MSAGAAQSIEPGQKVSRPIAPGETHGYEVALSAGEYLRFSLEGARAGLIPHHEIWTYSVTAEPDKVYCVV